VPRDEWAKARSRNIARKAERQKRTRRPRHAPHKRANGHWHPRAKLWFGKHKDQEIRQIPRSYLAWLCDQTANSWRLQHLQAFLRSYLARPSSGNASTPQTPNAVQPSKRTNGLLAKTA
jgi:hypothetical protein